MKNLFRLLLVVLLVAGATSVSAQKFGIINTQELVALMPELDSVQTKLQAIGQDLEAQLEEIQVEFNKKAEDFQAKLSTMTDGVRQARERELQELRARYSNFEQVAQQDMQQQQQKLMAPVVERAENAIKKVAKEGGFLIIFDDAIGSTIYIDEAQVTNIMPLVRKELGISPTAKPFGAAADSIPTGR